MTPQEILDIIEAFFNAVLKVLTALGFIKEDAEEGDATENA